jgi:hypothetical protein
MRALSSMLSFTRTHRLHDMQAVGAVPQTEFLLLNSYLPFYCDHSVSITLRSVISL